MICDPCKAAGTLLPSLPPGEGWRADALHAKCRGLECFCQHDTTATALRSDRMPDPRRGA